MIGALKRVRERLAAEYAERAAVGVESEFVVAHGGIMGRSTVARKVP